MPDTDWPDENATLAPTVDLPTERLAGDSSTGLLSLAAPSLEMDRQFQLYESCSNWPATSRAKSGATFVSVVKT